MTVTDSRTTTVAVCPLDALIPGRGVAALLPDGRQVAIFLTGDGRLYGLSNVDPFSRAAVLSRGIVGDSDGVPFVASPMLKQRFDLRTGACLDDETVVLRSYEVRAVAGVVHVSP
jgi:nitrite reductase (NADH) small subunit